MRRPIRAKQATEKDLSHTLEVGKINLVSMYAFEPFCCATRRLFNALWAIVSFSLFEEWLSSISILSLDTKQASRAESSDDVLFGILRIADSKLSCMTMTAFCSSLDLVTG